MIFDDSVVRKYEKMVAGIAWTFTNDPNLHLDLMQEGYIGLMKACEQYRAGKSSFTTYAHIKIRRQIQYYCEYKVDLVHIPIAHKKRLQCITLEIEGHELGYCNHEAEERDEVRHRL